MLKSQSNPPQKIRSLIKKVGLNLPTVVISLLFYLPLLAVVIFSFWERSNLWMEPAINFDAYIGLWSVSDQIIESIGIGLVAGTLSLIMAFPIAYYATFKLDGIRQMALLSILAIPFFVSSFIRIGMLIPILGDSGIINETLLTIGIINEPISILFTDRAVVIGALITHTPIVIFTGWLSMSMIDKELLQAAADLGAGPITTIRTIVLPLALPGLSIGALFVVAATMGSTIYPVVLGGPSSTSIGLLVERSFGQLNVPRAAAITVVTTSLYLVALYAVAGRLNLEKMFERFD